MMKFDKREQTKSFLLIIALIFLSCDSPCFAAFSIHRQIVQRVEIQNQHHESSTIRPTSSDLSVRLSKQEKMMIYDDERKKRHFCRCPEDDDDDEESLEDRREALFAMMGSLWSVGALPIVGEIMMSEYDIEPANAFYGSDAKMDFPDVMQGLSDRTNKQCLVESVGNRECLVYQGDEDKFLYKGADVETLLRRIQSAALTLEIEIPPLVEKKQWTKIAGILAGPMGQLSSTLTILAKYSGAGDIAMKRVQMVKQDLFEIGSGATLKKPGVVLKYRLKAIDDLNTFLKVLQ